MIRRGLLLLSVTLLGLSAVYLLYEWVRLVESYISAVML